MALEDLSNNNNSIKKKKTLGIRRVMKEQLLKINKKLQYIINHVKIILRKLKSLMLADML